MSVLRSDLNSLVVSNFYNAVYVDDDGNATLDDSKNQNMKVHLTEIPTNAFAFKCEENKENIFKPTVHGNSTHQICDYFMIVNHPLHLELFFFELKETQNRGNLKKASDQIKCSIPLLRYIVSGLQVHCEYGCQFPKNIWKEHYVTLFNKTTDKIHPHRKSALQWSPKTIHNLPGACACIVNRSLPLSTIRAESENAKNRAK